MKRDTRGVTALEYGLIAAVRRVAAVAGLAALVIGATRLALGLHTTTEVIVGGVLGVAGAVGFARTAGPVPALRLRWLFVVMMVVTQLLHGRHLNAEAHIRAATAALRIWTDGSEHEFP
jgi:Flp pilus assembly pilin Flp